MQRRRVALVGRSSECRRLQELVTDLAAGQAGVAVLRGPAGSGKSALLEYARDHAEGVERLACSGVEAESVVPFSALHDVLGPVLQYAAQIPEPQADALAAVLALRPAPTPDRFTAYLATFSLLAAAASDQPLLVTVDDLHWLDQASAEALAFAARRLAAEPVGVLFAARDGESVGVDVSGFEQIALAGLVPDAAAELVRRLHPAAADDVVGALTAATGGIPLAIREVVALLDDDQLRGTTPLPDPLPVGPRLEQAFERRLGELSPAAHMALLVAAVNETGAMGEIAGALRDLGVEPSAMAEAEDAGIVDIHDGVHVEFTHPLLRTVAYSRTLPSDRRRAHAALADTLTAEGEAYRRAWHLARAALAPDTEVAAALEGAGDQAAAAHAHAAAAQAYERAAALATSRAERSRLLLRAAGAMELAGRHDAVVRLVDQIAADADDITRADAERLRARADSWGGSAPDAYARLVEQASLLVAVDTTRAAELLVEATMPCAHAGLLREGLEAATRAAELATGEDGPVALAAAMATEAVGFLTGDCDEPTIVDVTPLLGALDPFVVNVAVTAATMALWSEQYDFARRSLEGVVAAARARATPGLTVLPLAWLGALNFRTGLWHRAVADANEAVGLATETGRSNERAHALVTLAHVYAAQGAEIDCLDALDDVLTRARSAGLGSLAHYAAATKGLLELGLGRHDRAAIDLEQASDLARRHGLANPLVVMWEADLIEAWARSGELARAERAAVDWQHRVERTHRWWPRASAYRCRGLVADDESFEDWFLKALAVEGAPMPFEQARTQLCFGERLRRAKRRTDARERLRAALSAFEELEAKPWAERARAELHASGEPGQPRKRGGPQDLTPQEMQVALTVAAGASNKEAAAALFLSAKTIEAHLGRVYRKLGIRSRAQLSRVLSAEASP